MKRVSILGLICLVILSPASLSLAQDTTAAMINSWKERADQGSAFVPFQLGWSYAHGQGVEKNFTEAARWYRLGAERGDFQAAFELAEMYLKGVGVEKNEAKAIEWYVKVGKSESILAPIARVSLLFLARKYSLGEQGVHPDKIKAAALFDHLFEIETAIMDRGQAQLKESDRKFNEALDTIKKVMPKNK
jgi:TPR repeat protein